MRDNCTVALAREDLVEGEAVMEPMMRLSMTGVIGATFEALDRSR